MRKLEDICIHKYEANKMNDSELQLLKEGMYLPDLYECKYICNGYDKLNCYTPKGVDERLQR